ncbi:MAG TPA: glycosyltransferase [Verrucomicrobiae bacterium]|nr:glycosyltransferase [Verrucomicrobiae bacterium]
MICLWVNKREWMYPGPILTVGLQNAHSLATIGIETHLCCGSGSASDTDRDLREFYGVEPHELLKVHRLSPPFGGNCGGSALFFARAFALARRLSKRDRLAVLTRDPGFLPFLACLCRNRAIRGFYEAHNFLADLSWRDASPGWAERRDGWLERRFLPRVSGLVAITRKQRELYQGIFPRLPSCALPLGTRPTAVAEEEMARRRGLRTLIYVGHLHGFKGVSRLLSFARKFSGAANVRLLFVGGAPQQLKRFRARAAALEKSGAVSFRPFVSPGELASILQTEASAGAVLLEDTYYNRYLTCPAKALDYISHGLPVLATDLPSNREILGDAGSYVQSRPELFDALIRLLGSPEAYAAASRAALARARELSWENRARQLAAFILDAFGERGGGRQD